MTKNILFLILFFFQFTFSQNTAESSQKLITTCKVWGFLKYYHPKVANGDFNWSNQLLLILPKVEQTKSKEEFSSLLESWIDSLGEVKEITPISETKEADYFDKNFDLNWITNSKVFTESISKKLKFIENNRFQGKQFYVGTLLGGNIFIKNEDFSSFKSDDKNSRMLALFTYWNLVEYFFPYKYLMDEKWNRSLEKMLPVFLSAQNDDTFYSAMQKLTAKLNDSHVVFFKYKNKKHYLPVICKIIDGKMIVTEVLNQHMTENYTINPGDVITKINDKSIKDIIREKRDLICASNEARFLHDIIEPVLSGKEDTITLEFSIKNKTVIKTVNWTDYNSNRYLLTNESKYTSKKEKIKIIGNNIGYVNMGVLKTKDIPELIDKLKTTKSIILDLRNYPKETYEGISNFINAEEKEFAIYTKPDLNYPGRFIWSEGSTCGFQNKNNYKGKVILLVNEQSLSQSEWTAMCFQTSGNTTIIGSQTAGADGNVTEIDYMPAFHSSFSGIGVYYPDKRETQRIGVTPDIKIKPTIKGIQEGRDEVLERALQFIESGK
ncbi:S41 family peptidase [Flavobacterium amniphilum]|uniref:S41 family peptidase n=1 Tax=Flavobacterium amniphilum TaxID=1834035 RepID=UPI00202A4138|nr:S41 family peptidase [Flavobacterium amniphilum]MCL9804961.1 S41 family peptidase [Flavobacterium amniphilum]